MTQNELVMKTVTKAEAQRQFDQLISEVASGTTSLTIEEDGKPVAVVLPVDQGAQRRAARTRVMKTIREMQETANLPPEEAEELARQAVREVRAASDHP